MINVNTTTGNQVEGLKLDVEISDLLFGHLTDAQKVSKVNESLLDFLVFWVSFDQGQSIADAAQYVSEHVTTVR